MVLPIVIPLVTCMPTKKVAITIDIKLLKEVDYLVNSHVFPNRSKAIQDAVREKLDRLKHTRLSRESTKLDMKEEQQMAEEGIDDQWPEY